MAKPTAKHPNSMIGAPSMYSDEIADYICDELSNGRSLVSICKDKGMPKPSVVFKWLRDERYRNFAHSYACAREAQADAIFDEALDIADTPVVGERNEIDAEGNVKTVKDDMLGHRRLQVDTRKWVAGKLRPTKYGDAQKLLLANPEGETFKQEIDVKPPTGLAIAMAEQLRGQKAATGEKPE